MEQTVRKMRVRVLFFGQLKDVVGRSSEDIELPDGATLATVFNRYASEFPRVRQMAGSIATARNHEFANLQTALADGDEVAFMPPVSGGSPWLAQAEDEQGFYAVTATPINARALVERAQGPDDGAVITFEGVVRNNSKGRATRYLDYECYTPLALKQMHAIGESVLDRHDIHRVAIVHRTGRLQIGEASIVIVVASGHRQAAYDASLEIINTVKKRVPVWKKEYFEDGEVWVEGEWDDSVTRSANAAS